MHEIDRGIATVAARQHGLVSREQATRVGATRRVIAGRLRTGRWEPVHRGVYRLAEYPRTWEADVMAACLLYGSRAYASHRTAGALRALAGIGPSTPIELAVRRGHARRRQGIRLYAIADSLGPADVEVIRSIPATAPARTLFDLAGVLPRDALEEALDDALARRLVTPVRLRWQARQPAMQGRSGIRAMRELLAERAPGRPTAESVQETRFARILGRAGIEGLVAQHTIRVDGRVVARVDFALPDLKIAIEVDGYRWHGGRARWERDLARRNSLAALGWQVLHVTSTDIDGGAGTVLEAVQGAIGRRQGWSDG